MSLVPNKKFRDTLTPDYFVDASKSIPLKDVIEIFSPYMSPTEISIKFGFVEEEIDIAVQEYRARVSKRYNSGPYASVESFIMEEMEASERRERFLFRLLYGNSEDDRKAILATRDEHMYRRKVLEDFGKLPVMRSDLNPIGVSSWDSWDEVSLKETTTREAKIPMMRPLQQLANQYPSLQAPEGEIVEAE